jgi:hypothetical protein
MVFGVETKPVHSFLNLDLHLGNLIYDFSNGILDQVHDILGTLVFYDFLVELKMERLGFEDVDASLMFLLTLAIFFVAHKGVEPT